MQLHVLHGVLLLVACATLQGVSAQPEEPLPVILGGIGNVANTATNFRESPAPALQCDAMGSCLGSSGSLGDSAGMGICEDGVDCSRDFFGLFVMESVVLRGLLQVDGF